MKDEDQHREPGPPPRQTSAPVAEADSDVDTVEEAFAAAVRHHQAGELEDAAALYRRVLEARPDHHDALNLLGVVMNRVGRSEVAVDLIGKALALKPDYAEAHSNLGVALAGRGKFVEAVATYRKALALKPEFADGSSTILWKLRGSSSKSTTRLPAVAPSTPSVSRCHRRH